MTVKEIKERVQAEGYGDLQDREYYIIEDGVVANNVPIPIYELVYSNFSDDAIVVAEVL